MGKPPKAVLFDCDGVLVDSEPITTRLMRDDLAAHGLDLSLERIAALFVGGTLPGVARQARDLGATLPEDWVDRFYTKAFAALAAEVEAVPGVSDLLDQLIAAGVSIAVGSNGPVAKMEITLTRTGLIGRLAPHIYSSHDLPQPKPAPDVYLHAARQLGVLPRDCIVVEDSVSGVRAGVAAGMRCIGFAAEGQGEQLDPHCDAIVGDMSDLARHLGV